MESTVLERSYILDTLRAEPGTSYHSSVFILARLHKYLADIGNSDAGKAPFAASTTIQQNVRDLDLEITDENENIRWERWMEKFNKIQSDKLEKKRNVSQSERTARMHADDVMAVAHAYGKKTALLLAELKNASSYYRYPICRYQMLSIVVDPGHGQKDGDVAIHQQTGDTNDSIQILDNLPYQYEVSRENSPENPMRSQENQRAALFHLEPMQTSDIVQLGSKRQPRRSEGFPTKRSCASLNSTDTVASTSAGDKGDRISSHRDVMSINKILQADIKHPLVRPAVSDQEYLVYCGQVPTGGTDRVLLYTWTTFSATRMLLQNVGDGNASHIPTKSDGAWYYYNTPLSVHQNFPFKDLLDKIQLSDHWTDERKKGLSETACLRIILPDESVYDDRTMCRVECIVRGFDAPSLH